MAKRWLVIDTCAADASGVALAEDARVIAQHELPDRTPSAGLLTAVHALLADAGWELDSLTAVGVVNGPGSFTGVRVGLAVAKGFCEALTLPMAAVSRLQVLGQASGVSDGLAALDAGRGEAYVRDIASGREFLEKLDALAERAKGRPVLVAEARLQEKLAGFAVHRVTLSVADAVPLVGDALRNGGSDVGNVEANYVRGEAQIYGSAAKA